jgi:soluble lytic murein transglycosylase-like protein
VRRPRIGGLAAAACAIGLFAGALGFPTRLADGPRSEGPPAPSVAAVPADDAAARVEVRLAERLALEPFERQRLARVLVAEAGAARIDPLLVVALIEIESSWDPRALSGRGAMGLMQLRAATMRRELERHGLPSGAPEDPVANVRAGVRYLRRLLDAFPREEVALMAYNAGPNRILGYLREGQIPDRFREYPRRVRAELRRLRRGLGPERAPVVAAAGVGAVAE